MPKALVIGASRGIGLALCHELLSRNVEVLATCRSHSDGLAALKSKVEIIEGIDMLDPQSAELLLDKTVALLKDQKLDFIYHNAGILYRETLKTIDLAGIQRQFEVNTLAPLRTTLALRKVLQAGSKVGWVTSRMGSIADNTSGGLYGYRISKAALNMAGKTLALDWASEGIAIGLLHPGAVATDMTGYTAPVAPEDAARGLVDRLQECSMENSGTFWHAAGQVLPW